MTLTEKYILVRVGDSSGRPALVEFFNRKLVNRFLLKERRAQKFHYDIYLLFAKMTDGTIRPRDINWPRLLKNEKN